MDRMLYLAMNGAKQTMLAQSVNSNNLANVSTTGFKADLEHFRSMQVFGPGMPSRVYGMTERPATDVTPGTFNTTGRDMDVAVRGEGWFAVQAPDGSEAYTRAGDLHIDATGMLTTGAGHPVIGNNGGPIVIPAAETLEIATDGTISIRPVGQAPNVLAEVDRIKMVNPPAEEMTKGEDALMHLKTGAQVLPPNAGMRLVSGALEGSNVNSVDALVKMIELQRQYETQVKLMNMAKENDQTTDQFLKMN